MQRLTRQSSALSLSTRSEAGALENCEGQDFHVDGRSRKRPTTEIIPNNDLAKFKRARRNGSDPNDEGEEVGEFIVVSSSRSSHEHKSRRIQHDDGDASSNSPTLSSSPVSSLGAVGSPLARNKSISGELKDAVWGGNDSQAKTMEPSELSHADSDTGRLLSDETCLEESNQTVQVAKWEEGHLLKGENLQGKSPKRSTSGESFLALSGGNDASCHQNTALSPWVSVNTPSVKQQSGSIGGSHLDAHAEEMSPKLKNPSAVTERTPLPKERGETNTIAFQVLSHIPRDSRYVLTRPSMTTFLSTEESNTVAEERHVKDAEMGDNGPTTKSTPLVRTSPLSLHSLCSPVSGLHNQSRQLYASMQPSIPGCLELLNATADSSIHTPGSSVRVPSREAPAFSTFASQFKVTTTDSVEQDQASVQKQKRRHRRMNASEETRHLTSSPVETQHNYQQGATVAKQETASDLKLVLSSNQSFFPEAITQEAISQKSSIQALESISQATSETPSTMIGNVVAHSPPIQSVLPRLPPLSQLYCPPAVEFTVDNRAESTLPPSDVTNLFASLSKNASLLLVPDVGHSCNAHPPQPIGILMWQTLPGFYSWHSNLTGVTVTGSLRFELTDVHWQSQNSFVLPHNNLGYFRALKQYIWDLYWMATSVNRGISPFRVYIAPYPIEAEHAISKSSQSSEWNSDSSRDVSDRQNNQLLPDFQARHESRNELRSHSMIDDQVRQSPDLRCDSLVTGNRSGKFATSGPSSSHQAASPTAVSPSGMIHSLRLTPSKPSPDATSWHSHRMPNQSSIKATTSNSADSRQTLPPQFPQASIAHVRTEFDRTALRQRAAELRPHDMELLEEESTVYDKFPYKTGAQVAGAVIDKMSGIGTVSITGKGYISLNIPTGIEEVEDRYQKVNINPKQTCMLHKGAIVLYYRRRTPSESAANLEIERSSYRNIAPSTEIPAMNSETSGSAATRIHPSRPILSKDITETPLADTRSAEVSIFVRLQVEKSGKFSVPFDKSFLRPSITVTEFFSWFATNSGLEKPGPATLQFTFKDAMPAPTSTQIARGNEDHFKLMRKDIKVQCAKAKAFMPELKEFVILITVPGWDMPTEEDW